MLRCCENCGRPFEPSKFHPEQTYCTRAGCRLASRRAARKAWRTREQTRDPVGFNAREAKRVRAWRSRKKHGIKARSPLQVSAELEVLRRVSAALGLLVRRLACALGTAELVAAVEERLHRLRGAGWVGDLDVTGFGSEARTGRTGSGFAT